MELIEEFNDKWNWNKLSSNKYLPWSEEIIEKFSDKWTWDILCWNQSLPWSKKLIDKFKDKWTCECFHLSNIGELTLTEFSFEKHIEKWEKAANEWGTR